jgi:hypothetical protein
MGEERGMTKVVDQFLGARFGAYCVDAVEFTAGLPDASVDFSVYSPPFSSLYIYSESARDMGNVSNDAEFQATYRHLLRELFRVTRPGRLTAIHVKDLVFYSNSSDDGSRGLRPFTMESLFSHLCEGWTYHRMITIQRCPVKEMQKTKADRLLYKHFREDAARTGGGMPEYVLVFRKWAAGMDETPRITHSREEYPLDVWQDYAQPAFFTQDLWPDMRETDVLNVKAARDGKDEKHLCPMPLDITERLVRQYTNPGETVFSPFMGIGSEGFVALKHGRRFIGSELKPSYFDQAVRNLREAEHDGQAALFEGGAAGIATIGAAAE